MGGSPYDTDSFEAEASLKRNPPTMTDVARLAGVTSMTVSRALREGSSVSDETRKRIVEAADSLGYVIDRAAAGLKVGRTGFVGVIIPTLNNSNFAETVQGVTDRLAVSQRQVLLGYTNYDCYEEERVIESFLVRRPEAMVVTGSDHTPKARRMLEHAEIPIVEIWDLPSNPIDLAVGFSNREAGRILTRHLHENGYRRIAFIGGTAIQDRRGMDRRAGYEDEIRQLGLEPRVLALGEPPITINQGAGALGLLQQRWPDLDAAICVSDLLAFGLLMECNRMGIAVPGSLAVAGFGNYDLAQCVVPSLTTVDFGARSIGVKAADIVLKAIDARRETPPKALVSSEISLVVRHST